MSNTLTSLALLTIVPLCLAACTSNDDSPDPDPNIVKDPPVDAVCGNGTLEAGEECDGATMGVSTCADRGYAAGDLACSAECTVDTTSCILLDGDNDGLAYDAELAAGTDPNNHDSDGDGLLDGMEVDNGSNPLDAYSYPAAGMWPNRLAQAQADGVVPTGFGHLMVPPNMQFIDQLGEAISLYQFYGYIVVVSVGALWCPPCQQAAASSEQLWRSHIDDGVFFIEVLVDGNQPGVDATADDQNSWINSYQMNYAVVRTDNLELLATALPTYYFFDRNLRQYAFFQGFPGDPALSSLIDSGKQL